VSAVKHNALQILASCLIEKKAQAHAVPDSNMESLVRIKDPFPGKSR